MGLEIPIKELKAIIEQAKNIAQIALKLTSIELYGNIKEESPVDEGRLQGSWEIKQLGQFLYQIFTNVAYALAVHDGSKPHEIWPKGITYKIKKGSYFSKGSGSGPTSAAHGLYWKGARHPVRMVNHPGYKGNPFTEPAISRTEDRLDEFVQTALDKMGA